ncbi:MAG: hypothetical protein ACLR2E_07080 [Lachnospiraceae bacterium]
MVKILYQPETETERHTVRSLGSCWYQIRDGEKITLELPCQVLTDADGKAVLYNEHTVWRKTRERSCLPEEYRIIWKSIWGIVFFIITVIAAF